MKRTRTFKHTAESVTAARRFVGKVLEDVPAEVRETITLMVSELASNCVRHTDSDFDLTISKTGKEIRVEATDCGAGEPRMRTPAPTDPSGRGLQIVDMFSTAWGYDSLAGKGKTVWFSVALDPSPSHVAPMLS